MTELSNFEINEKENYCLISLNPKIYPLDVIYTTGYMFTDRAYVLIDGEPDSEIIVELRPKKKYNLKKLAREFNNEILNYLVYLRYKDKNSELRKIILLRVLLTNDLELTDEEILDPEGIAAVWDKEE